MEIIENLTNDYNIENNQNSNINTTYPCKLIPHLLYQSNSTNKNYDINLQRKSNINKETNLTYNENFIKFMRFVPNNKELILITNRNKIFLSNLNIENNSQFNNNSNYEISYKDIDYMAEESQMIFEENNHIYDLEMYFVKK